MANKKAEEKTGAFATTLRSLREKAGMTQAALATAADLHISVVFKIEQGIRNDPSWNTVQALAAALGVTCLAFADDRGAKPAKGKRK